MSPEKQLFPTSHYDHRNCLGLYRLIPATVSKKELSYNYTWNGINPAPEFAWKYPKETLNKLAYEKKLHIEQNKVFIKKYRDEEGWARSAMLNTACSGKFSSDRTIEEYVQDIWHLEKVKVEL